MNPPWFRPESAAIHPTAIKDCSNGKIPASLLKPCGIRRFVLVDPAATAMRMMVAAARRDGVSISATGTYRSYDGQVNLFLRRYQQTESYPGARHEEWNGKEWWLRKGVAGAAVPGRSNHGWGLAVDLARINRVGKVVTLDARTLQWLHEKAPKFGWFNTVHSENWHWCYCLGDRLPDVDTSQVVAA